MLTRKQSQLQGTHYPTNRQKILHRQTDANPEGKRKCFGITEQEQLIPASVRDEFRKVYLNWVLRGAQELAGGAEAFRAQGTACAKKRLPRGRWGRCVGQRARIQGQPSSFLLRPGSTGTEKSRLLSLWLQMHPSVHCRDDTFQVRGLSPAPHRWVAALGPETQLGLYRLHRPPPPSPEAQGGAGGLRERSQRSQGGMGEQLTAASIPDTARSWQPSGTCGSERGQGSGSWATSVSSPRDPSRGGLCSTPSGR